jgi:hypothetical protein
VKTVIVTKKMGTRMTVKPRKGIVLVKTKQQVKLDKDIKITTKKSDFINV